MAAADRPAPASPRPSLPASPQQSRTPRRAPPAISVASQPSASAHSKPASVASPARQGCARRPAAAQPPPVHCRRPGSGPGVSRTHQADHRRGTSPEPGDPHRRRAAATCSSSLLTGCPRAWAASSLLGLMPAGSAASPKAQRHLAGVEDGATPAVRLHRSHEVGIEVGRAARGRLPHSAHRSPGAASSSTRACSAARCSGPMVGPGSLILV